MASWCPPTRRPVRWAVGLMGAAAATAAALQPCAVAGFVRQRWQGDAWPDPAQRQKVDLPDCHAGPALPPPRRACSYACLHANSAITSRRLALPAPRPWQPTRWWRTPMASWCPPTRRAVRRAAGLMGAAAAALQPCALAGLWGSEWQGEVQLRQDGPPSQPAAPLPCPSPCSQEVREDPQEGEPRGSPSPG